MLFNPRRDPAKVASLTKISKSNSKFCSYAITVKTCSYPGVKKSFKSDFPSLSRFLTNFVLRKPVQMSADSKKAPTRAVGAYFRMLKNASFTVICARFKLLAPGPSRFQSVIPGKYFLIISDLMLLLVITQIKRVLRIKQSLANCTVS